MLRQTTHPTLVTPDKQPRQPSQLAKSTLMSSILSGTNISQPNSHFIDSLERFKKDYSVYDKEVRELQRQKKLRILEERKNLQVQRESRIRRNQLEYDQRNNEKVQQSRHLCQLGLKKTGYSNGLPMNPITLQYHQNPFGFHQKFTDEEIKLRKLVRAHHIQNASTSGFNPINGQSLPSIDSLVPKNTEGRLQEKLCKFYDTKRLNPNIDLGLNPKTILPKNVGEVQRGCQSPIKSQKWDNDEGPEFQSSYQSHFNQKPHEVVANSRLQQSNLYKHYMEQSIQMKAQKTQQLKQNLAQNSNYSPVQGSNYGSVQTSNTGAMQDSINRAMQGSNNNQMKGQTCCYPRGESAINYMPREAVQRHFPEQKMMKQSNNQNVNPYVQSHEYQSRMYEMRR